MTENNQLFEELTHDLGVYVAEQRAERIQQINELRTSLTDLLGALIQMLDDELDAA